MKDFIKNTAALDYWESNPNAMYVADTWIANRLIVEHVYRKISKGKSNKHWLNWVLEDHLGTRFSHAICPGCGTGGHEISMLRSGFVENIDGFDFSSSSIALAKQAVINESISGAHFYVDNLNEFTLAKNTYDLACFAGSLHHANNLEHCLTQVKDSLTEEGVIIVWEYVGPCYLLWRDKQIECINEILSIIPPEFKVASDAVLKRQKLDQQLKADPSEATRSSLIPELLPEYFEIIYEVDVGGTILHPIYPLLNHSRLIQGDPYANLVLNLIIKFEESLINNGVLNSDFKFYIGRRR